MSVLETVVSEILVDRGGSTPHQYAIPKDAKELQDLIEHRNMNFAVGNIFKACYRMGFKEGADELYDINKILFFAEREKVRLLKQRDHVGIPAQGILPREVLR